MTGFTGIEYGPDSCILVRAQRRAEAIELCAAHIVEPSEWPPQPAAAAELLKGVRREKMLPRVARVVAWGLAEGAGPRDIATRAALRPLIAAGFRIGAVMSPPQALAILAADRPRPSGAASVWLAINRHGAAIAIVRGGELLYSRSFGWNWDGAAIGSQAQLLQRYSIVAHLAPEVRRGIELVRTKRDVNVEAAVTCGDYPDLRSLTMPLIEELDLEVETLDSVEGLIIPPTARRDHLPDSLSVVRLACAAAAGRRVAGLQVDVVGVARAAAYAVAVGALAWIGYVWWAGPQPAATVVERNVPNVAASTPADRRAPVASRAPIPPPRSSSPVEESTSSVAESAAPSATQRAPVPPVTTSPGATPPVSPPIATAPPIPTPSPQAPPRASQPRASNPGPRSERTTTPIASASRPERGAARPRSASADTPGTRPSAPPPSPAPATAPADVPPPPVTAAPPVVDASAPRTPRGPAPLKDPLPVIDTILVSSDRRLAVIDGAFVGIGDTLGQRTVVRIEVDAVFFREPSGLEIRVPIRMRRLP